MSEQTQEMVRYEGNAPVKTSRNLSGLLERPDIQDKLARVAAKHLTPERLVGMVLMAASRQPKLLECTQASLLKSAMTASKLGLDCSGILGRAYLVPFYNKHIRATEAVFIPGYLGLMDLARRSGDIKSMVARVVYKDEWFEVDYSADIPFVHKPDLDGKKEDANIRGAYFYARFVGGGWHFEWMNRADIEAIRAISKAADGNFWTNWYPDMCKKTVARKGLKFCPLSTESQQAIAQAEEDEFAREPSRAVERGSITIEDLQPVDHSEDAPIDVEPGEPETSSGPSLASLWKDYLADLKRNRKASKECLAMAEELLGAEYSMKDLVAIEQQGLADVPRFQMFLARCTTDLEKDDWLK